MNVINIIATSADRAEAIARLIAAGCSRQEAKVLTFHMQQYARGMGARALRCTKY